MRYIILICFYLAVFSYANGQTTLVLPEDSVVTQNQYINFIWDDVAAADSFHLEIGSDENFSVSVKYKISSADTVFLAPYTEFHWRVQSFVNGIPGAYSNSRFVSVIDVSSFAPKAWYSADSNVTISGANQIDSWDDISGQNNHAVQPNTSNKPTLLSTSAALNNQPTVVFDGSDYLNTPSLNTTDFEVLMIGKGNDVQNVYLGIGLGYRVNGPAGSGGMLFLTGNNFQYFSPAQSTGVYQYHNFGFLNGDATDNSFIRINKNALSKGGSAYDSPFTVNDLRIGNANLDGEIAEILVFDRHLSATEKEQLEAYLYFKYAPPVNLGQNVVGYGFCDTTLRAGKHFTSYLWSDGSTEDSLIVSEAGTYWVEAEDIFGNISRDSIEITFPEFQNPTSQLYCPTESKTWNPQLGAHYSYLWSDGSTADTLEINTPGDFHVIVTDTNGCVYKSDTLSFGEDPFSTTATLGPDTSLCAGNAIGLTTGANAAVNYLWNTGATTPTITITSAGTYDVIAENGNGCQVKDTITVSVSGVAPSMQADLPESICTDEVFNFQDETTTTDGSTVIAWEWTFGDGDSAAVASGTHAYDSSGFYPVQLTVETSSGCYNQLIDTLEVKKNPVLTFATSDACEAENVQFNGGQLSPQTISNWVWNFDDPNSGSNNTFNGQNSSHVYTSPGDYEVMLTGTDVFGCVDSIQETQTILPTPAVDFEFEEVCAGQTVNYENTSTIAAPATIDTYQWSFGDGTQSTQTNPQKPYSAHGVYTVELTASADNGCSNSESEAVKVHAIPQIQFSVAQNCSGLSTQFSDNSYVPDGSVAEVDWKFGNALPISGINVNKTFTEEGVYTFNQTVKSGFGCLQSKEGEVTIHPALKADFIFNPNAFVADYPIQFESTSTGASAYNWTFGNFASSQQPDTSVVFDTTQIGSEQTVVLRVENEWNCTDTLKITRPVVAERTDLSLSQLFTQENNGFLTIGVRLKNEGSTPITSADLILRSPGNGVIKETWSGLLQANEEEIYIFSASPSANKLEEEEAQDYLCIEGRILTPAQFQETDFSNNEVCKAMSEEQAVVVKPYPNPVSDELTVQVVLPKSGSLTLKAYNYNGQLVSIISDSEAGEEGLNEFKINTTTWNSGKYMIYVSAQIDGVENVVVTDVVVL